MLNWGFMGVLSVQICKSITLRNLVLANFKWSDFYYINFPDDKKFIKSLVYSLFLLDLLQTFLLSADGFHWFAYGFGNMAQFDETFLSPWDTPFLDAIIACVVQLFYCWRIYIIRGKSFFIPLLIAAVSEVLTTKIEKFTFVDLSDAMRWWNSNGRQSEFLRFLAGALMVRRHTSSDVFHL